MNVLITAASRRVALIRLFREALRSGGGKVIAVDYEVHSPALFFADRHYKVPLVKERHYLSSILDICKRENISLIVPTIDQELVIWAGKKGDFLREGVFVSISAADTIGTFTDKWNTYQALTKEKIPFPHTFIPAVSDEPDGFPLFIKPRKGRGSVGAFQVKNSDEYTFFTKYVHDPVMQTYLDGKEFTVDAFFDRKGKLIQCIPRYRLVIRSGVSDKGITFRNEALTQLIVDIGEKFRFEGAINVQGKIMNEAISFFEINPRFSGGIQLSAAAGTSFPLLLVREMAGEPLSPDLYGYQVGMMMTSYEDSFFIDSMNHLVNPPYSA